MLQGCEEDGEIACPILVFIELGSGGYFKPRYSFGPLDEGITVGLVCVW